YAYHARNATTASTIKPHLVALYAVRFQALNCLRFWSMTQCAWVSLLIAPVWSPLSLGELAADITTRPNQRLKDSAQPHFSGRWASQSRMMRLASVLLCSSCT